MRCTSGYTSIWCISLHQLQPRDMMAPEWQSVGTLKKKKAFYWWSNKHWMTDGFERAAGACRGPSFAYLYISLMFDYVI